MGGGALDARLERSAGDGEGAALATAGGADAVGIDLGHVHDDAGQLGGIEEDVAVEHVVGRAVEAADDVAAQRGAVVVADILRGAALAAAIEGGDGEALGDVAELVQPGAGVAGVAVEHEDGGAGAGRGFRAQEFGVDAGARTPVNQRWKQSAKSVWKSAGISSTCGSWARISARARSQYSSWSAGRGLVPW